MEDDNLPAIFGSKWYILDDEGNPVVENNPHKLAEWWANNDRTLINQIIGEVTISTVFLSLDHQHGEGPPLLFETMIFGGKYDETQWRYATKEEALNGHAEAVFLVRTELH